MDRRRLSNTLLRRFIGAQGNSVWVCRVWRPTRHRSFRRRGTR